MILMYGRRGLDWMAEVVDNWLSYFEPVKVDVKHQKIARVYFANTKPKNKWYSNRPISEGGWLERQREKAKAWWGKWWGDRVTDIALGVLDSILLLIFLAGVNSAASAISMAFAMIVALAMAKLVELSNQGAVFEWDLLNIIVSYHFFGLVFLLVWFNLRAIKDSFSFIRWLNGEEDGKGNDR